MVDERGALVGAPARFGDAPAGRELQVRVTILGGAALLLTGQISRPTQEVGMLLHFTASDG